MNKGKYLVMLLSMIVAMISPITVVKAADCKQEVAVKFPDAIEMRTGLFGSEMVNLIGEELQKISNYRLTDITIAPNCKEEIKLIRQDLQSLGFSNEELEKGKVSVSVPGLGGFFSLFGGGGGDGPYLMPQFYVKGNLELVKGLDKGTKSAIVHVKMMVPKSGRVFAAKDLNCAYVTDATVLSGLLNLAGITKDNRTAEQKAMSANAMTVKTQAKAIAEWVKTELDKIPWRTGINAIKNNKVYIYHGAKEGLAVGQEFTVLDYDTTVNPDTEQAIVSKQPKIMAKLKAETVKDYVTVCTVVSGQIDSLQETMFIQIAN